VTGAKVADYFFVSLSLSHSTTFSSSALSSAASVGDCFSKRRPWLLSRSRIAFRSFSSLEVMTLPFVS
jgi:hypothetical protein